MKQIDCRRTVTIPSTARDWQLYTTMKGVGAAAKALTDTLTTALRLGESRVDIENAMIEVMRKYEDFGADDTEPRWVLANTLNAILGTKR